MDATCSVCNKTVSGRDINYTANAAVICQACLDRGQGPGGALAREYEFDLAENDVIRTLAGPMKFVGVISIVFGILNGIIGLLALGHLQGVLTLGEGIALIAIGGWLASAAGAFRDIVNTEGSDISNLMIALRKLRSAFTLQAWLLGIACAFLGVILLLVIMH